MITFYVFTETKTKRLDKSLLKTLKDMEHIGTKRLKKLMIVSLYLYVIKYEYFLHKNGSLLIFKSS